MKTMHKMIVTLETDLAEQVEVYARRRGVSFEQAWNEALRRGLTPPGRRDNQIAYTVEPHAGGFRPGIDPDKLDQLVDQLDVERFVMDGRPHDDDPSVMEQR